MRHETAQAAAPGADRGILDGRGNRFEDGEAKDYQLTEREKEILNFMANGLFKKEIAVRNGLSIHTVSTPIRHIYDLLQVSSKTATVAKALRTGLV